MNEHAIIKTNLKNVQLNAAHICECDFKVYLKEQTSEVAKTLEAKIKLEAKLLITWYPLAREDLAQLVYQVSLDLESPLKKFIEFERFLFIFICFCRLSFKKKCASNCMRTLVIF